MKYASSQRYTLSFGLLIALFVACGASVPTAHAYVTTSQQAVALTDTTALFTVTYAFGSEKSDFYLPIMTKRDLENGAREKLLGYTILEEGKRATTTGTSIGLVLSDAQIVDGLYKIPKGHVGYMTLMVLFTVDPTEEETDYALKVNELPFFLGDMTNEQHLNSSELTTYVTPEAELNNEE